MSKKKTSNEIEYRGGFLRAKIEEGDDSIKVSGYAAVFGEEASMGGYYAEVIEAGAFGEALERGDDVTFLVEHSGLPLARSTSGTLEVKEDSKGLYVSSELDLSDPDVARIVPKLRRGDLSKMSFAFIPTKEQWEDRGEDMLPVRRILSVELRDVSIVVRPAYQGTEIGLRSYEAFKEELEKNKRGAAANIEQRMRMRLALNGLDS